MTTPFSRSIRVLEADKFQRSLLIIGLAVVVLAGWIIWFFLAQVTLLEVGDILSISPTGEVRAEFTGQTAQRVRIGQPGWLQLDGEAGDALGLVPAIVVAREPVAGRDLLYVNMVVLDGRFFTVSATDSWSGQVQVVVEQVSPATLFLRSSGQFTNAPRVSTP